MDLGPAEERGLGFRVWGFRVEGLGFRIQGLGFRVSIDIFKQIDASRVPVPNSHVLP